MTRVWDDTPTMTQSPLAAKLRQHAEKSRQAYEHALAVEERFVFAAWLNEVDEQARIRAQKRAVGVAWALQGGRLPRRATMPVESGGLR